MMIDNVNLNHLRIFETVYRTRSMTVAARERNLTQSGISQHIKALEDSLGRKLFDRMGKKIIPTREADSLFRECAEMFQRMETLLRGISGRERRVAGRVNVGAPVEFANNVIMPLLGQLMSEHPELRFSIKYGVASEMQAALLAGELDFAFVDSFQLNPRIDVTRVYDEEIHLCALGKPGLRDPGDRIEPFSQMDFVDYEPGEEMLRLWFEHHFGANRVQPRVRAFGMNARGVAALLVKGFGAGLLPGHLIGELKSQGVRLLVFKGRGVPLRNKISLIRLPERTRTYAAEFSESALRDLLSGGRRVG